MTRGGLVVAGALLASIGLHAAPVLGPAAVDWARAGSGAPGGTDQASIAPAPATPTPRTPEQLQRERERLVTEAFADRAQGRLVLSEFLLEADALDAEAEGVMLDIATARVRFTERCTRFRERVAQQGVPKAMASAFGDMPYSIAVNRMAGMLLSGLGACGPTAQLMASCAYDSASREGLALRYWGGVNAGGTTHITATWRDGAVEVDLAEGGPVQAGGGDFPAEEIVEAYARGHGILPPLAGAEVTPEPKIDAAAVASFVYPPNADVFTQSVPPLFAETRQRGAAAGLASGPGAGDAPIDALGQLDEDIWRHFSEALLHGAALEQEPRCPLDPRALHSPTVTLPVANQLMRVELIPTLRPASLAYAATVLAGYQSRAPRTSEVEALLVDSCLALGYRWAALRFSAAGHGVIAREASERAARHRTLAEQRHRRLMAGSPAGVPQELAKKLDNWVLIAFEDGRETLLNIEIQSAVAGTHVQRPHFSRDRRTRALLMHPDTRSRLLAAAPRFAFDERLLLIGVLATAKLSGQDEDLELPKDGFIPAAMAAYDRMLIATRGPDLDPDVYFERWREVMLAVGAGEAELLILSQDVEILRRSWAKAQRR